MQLNEPDERKMVCSKCDGDSFILHCVFQDDVPSSVVAECDLCGEEHEIAIVEEHEFDA